MVYIEMSFGERCQLFQHFKFLCQVRIFSSNYIILIFWSIHVWYMVIRVIGKKTGWVNMIKKVISVVIAICLMFISTIEVLFSRYMQHHRLGLIRMIC